MRSTLTRNVNELDPKQINSRDTGNLTQMDRDQNLVRAFYICPREKRSSYLSWGVWLESNPWLLPGIALCCAKLVGLKQNKGQRSAKGSKRWVNLFVFHEKGWNLGESFHKDSEMKCSDVFFVENSTSTFYWKSFLKSLIPWNVYYLTLLNSAFDKIYKKLQQRTHVFL